ncbi:MAG: protein tyrosine phosphatase [Sphingobacterium sp.]|jgi:tyrosine-protein phosphatase YwqE|uniref:tyrosine-protein phosphatase n=1 Tax=Sphingobacterium sp. CZ-UAM TaxID=1933868 RepID=UPI000986CCD7|nr:CpsB/CapC family capsule biosynthesis tyrosine phosphatase [Sphingobacterium sp. CZ-UAM]MDF2516533.1 protein tyrosine phosphatase [Sphingobacterium sp.]OOG16640.1 protein tyrosine phosphatase [Sphingobacterium sp. CZ-UAM]
MGIFSKLFGNKTQESKIKVVGALAFLEVDMHNHILPGIDDGSQSIEQSIDLLKGLGRMGFEKFICTPHIMDGVHPNTIRTIEGAKNKLVDGLKELPNRPEIHHAAEHMIDDGIARLIEANELCVMPGGYVLIEMSYLQESKALFQTILDIQKLGYQPILAHPERYNYYHYNFNMYKQIKDAGCMLQLNLLSISRYYGVEVKSAALTMIKSGMYDFVGTDVHHGRHLAALEEIVAKYPVRDLLKTCSILNPTLQDHLKNDDNIIAAG